MHSILLLFCTLDKECNSTDILIKHSVMQVPSHISHPDVKITLLYTNPTSYVAVTPVKIMNIILYIHTGEKRIQSLV